MKAYRHIAIAAVNAGTDEKTLFEFSREGWIEVIFKDERGFISGQDEYRSRFILHLREKLKLTDEQIGIVLANAKPPYSVDKVAAILAQHTTEF